jgi:hypothetical protein
MDNPIEYIIKQELFDLLEEHDAHDKFIANLSINIKNHDEFNSAPAKEQLNNAFIWGKSPEGLDFWYDIYYKMQW